MAVTINQGSQQPTMPTAPGGAPPPGPGPGGLQPGEDQPLPQDAQNNPATGKGTAPPTTGRPGVPGAPAGTKDAKGAAPTKQPTITPFAKDTVSVESGAGSVAAVDEPGAKPFGDYGLPPGETKVEGKRQVDTDELHSALAVGLTDVVKELFQPGTIQGIQERTAFLRANPSESMFNQLAGPEFGNKFAAAFTEALAGSTTKELMTKEFGAGAVAMTGAANQLLANMLVGNGLLGANIPTNQLVAGMLGKFLGVDPASLKMPSFGGANEGGAAAGAQDPGGATGPGVPVGPDGVPLLGPDGLPTKEGLAMVGNNLGPALEAAMEFYIASSARLIKGDTGKDVAVMTARLNQLKIEKKELIANIITKEASVLGLELSQNAAVKEAQAAEKCAQTWSLVGCIVACVVAIVVAVVVSIFSFGAAAPAMALVVAGVIGCTASVAAGLLIACAVCAIIAAVCTLVTNMPMILHGISLLLAALGFSDAAKSVEDASVAVKTWYAKNAWFTYLMMGISIACALFMLVVMLPAAAASTATIASATTTLTSQITASTVTATMTAAQVAEATAAAATTAASLIQMVSTFNTIMTLVNLTSAVLNCTTQIATSIIGMQLAKLQAEIDALTQQLAMVDVEIKKLLQQIDQKRQEEDQVKEDIQQRQDTEQSIMQSLNKAAESYTQMLQATSLV